MGSLALHVRCAQQGGRTHVKLRFYALAGMCVPRCVPVCVCVCAAAVLPLPCDCNITEYNMTVCDGAAHASVCLCVCVCVPAGAGLPFRRPPSGDGLLLRQRRAGGVQGRGPEQHARAGGLAAEAGACANVCARMYVYVCNFVRVCVCGVSLNPTLSSCTLLPRKASRRAHAPTHTPAHTRTHTSTHTNAHTCTQARTMLRTHVRVQVHTLSHRACREAKVQRMRARCAALEARRQALREQRAEAQREVLSASPQAPLAQQAEEEHALGVSGPRVRALPVGVWDGRSHSAEGQPDAQGTHPSAAAPIIIILMMPRGQREASIRLAPPAAAAAEASDVSGPPGRRPCCVGDCACVCACGLRMLWAVGCGPREALWHCGTVALWH